jgi:hypothetical protein
MFLQEPPADPSAVAAVNPADIHVDIRNGSGVSGQGAALADYLRKRGFVVLSVRNADSFGYDATEIHVHSSQSPLAGERVRAAIALATATVQPDASPQKSDVTVIVGRDFAATNALRRGPAQQAPAEQAARPQAAAPQAAASQAVAPQGAASQAVAPQ